MAPGEKLDYQLDDVNCAHMTGWDNSMLFSRGILWVTNYQLIWKSTEKESMVPIITNTNIEIKLIKDNRALHRGQM